MWRRDFISSITKFRKYIYTTILGNLQLHRAFLQLNKSNFKNTSGSYFLEFKNPQNLNPNNELEVMRGKKMWRIGLQRESLILMKWS